LELAVLGTRGRVARAEKRIDDAIAFSERGIAVAQENFGDYSLEHARAWSYYSTSLWFAQRFKESVEASEKALKLHEVLLGKDDPQLVWRYGDIGDGYRMLGRDDEALQWLERAYDLAIRFMDPQSVDLAEVIIGLAYQLTLSNPERALTLLATPIAVYEKAQSPTGLAWALEARARAWVGLDHGAEALTDCERAHQLAKQMGSSKEEAHQADVARCRGNAFFVLRRYQEAAVELSNARSRWKPLNAPGSRARLALELARARHALGAPVEEVRKLAEEGLHEIANFPAASVVKREIIAFLEALPANGRAFR
jgi:tetratricopeptide (TPR) repeat protein